MNFGRHFGRAVCYRYGPLDAGGSYAVARVHSQWGVDPLGVARVTEVLFECVRVERRVERRVQHRVQHRVRINVQSRVQNRVQNRVRNRVEVCVQNRVIVVK